MSVAPCNEVMYSSRRGGIKTALVYSKWTHLLLKERMFSLVKIVIVSYMWDLFEMLVSHLCTS